MDNNAVKYQILVIGAGPAGMTAGIYAGRAGLKTLVIDNAGYGGQMLMIDRIENYPGISEKVNGFDLAKKMHDQMVRFGAEHRVDKVNCVKKSGDYLEVACGGGSYICESVIVAVGAKPKSLGVPGEKEFVGKGVSYCAVCDGNFFKNKDVMVVGGGNTALEEAEYLSRIASRVVVVHRRDEFRAEKIIQERVKSNDKIFLMMSSVLESIEGEDMVERAVVKNLKSRETETLRVSGVFVFVGQAPQTGFVDKTLKTDKNGFIVVDGKRMTSLKGVFACGDCARTEFWQLVTACAEGAEAAHNAAEFVNSCRT